VNAPALGPCRCESATCGHPNACPNQATTVTRAFGHQVETCPACAAVLTEAEAGSAAADARRRRTSIVAFHKNDPVAAEFDVAVAGLDPHGELGMYPESCQAWVGRDRDGHPALAEPCPPAARCGWCTFTAGFVAGYQGRLVEDCQRRPWAVSVYCATCLVELPPASDAATCPACGGPLSTGPRSGLDTLRGDL